MAKAKQTLDIRIINCGGMSDLMSELESSFLVDALGLFRNRPDLGRGTPRAKVNLVRAYKAADFYGSAFSDADMLHIVGHSSSTELDVGYAKKRVKPSELGPAARRAGLSLPQVIVSTSCKLQGKEWRDGFGEAGAEILIASRDDVTPAALTAFDMAFYAALLAHVRKGKTLRTRVKESFKVADRYYRAIHARGTPFAKFELKTL